jgi:beta-glucosidase
MRTKTQFLSLLAVALPALGDVITGIPDSAPAGFEEWVSPIVLPAPPVVGKGDWRDAVLLAQQFVSKLTLEEKINVTTGIDVLGRCVGNTGVRLLTSHSNLLNRRAC